MISKPVSRVSWEPAWQNDQHTWHFWETPLASLDGADTELLLISWISNINGKNQMWISVCVSLQISSWLLQRKAAAQNIPRASKHAAKGEWQKGTNLAAVQFSLNLAQQQDLKCYRWCVETLS